MHCYVHALVRVSFETVKGYETLFCIQAQFCVRMYVRTHIFPAVQSQACTYVRMFTSRQTVPITGSLRVKLKLLAQHGCTGSV